MDEISRLSNTMHIDLPRGKHRREKTIYSYNRVRIACTAISNLIFIQYLCLFTSAIRAIHQFASITGHTDSDVATVSISITRLTYHELIELSIYVLILIYSLNGDQGRRYARVKELQVKSVKENAQAQARWFAAKDAIKKRAIQVSHSFSRRNIVLPSMQCGATSGRMEIESGHPPPIQDNGDYSNSLEEKAQQQQNRDLSFSAAVSMAINGETRSRPTIEIAFRDLMVTLKEKKKHLLRSVTGEIRPGRITALMGPSGAGKTTLLSALAGKTVGCSIAGLILINGKVESIRSYKKIVGFVPQDDVVHGNLTVEENIWFSANCRLSADLPKADKVLVVERVIESLGLQPVRDSLVGTVEKRGISGGQRKRVNVGLELVMEPSLLFLDEPTSGLDSSSSQLLLRALKREAL
ncbi:UNVERIFIED_CONTAM: ABC transporter G family member 28 [Sesamum latifolium]|uniref:ABC transporter G family member 28 n=1 Tax=Sesamum latifolium TaxID=2727402 RepID=A0AAW2XCP2_9LAMI